MMTYDKATAIGMVATILLDHNLADPAYGGGDGSPTTRARSQAADLLDEYQTEYEENRDVVECSRVVSIISDLLDEVEERTGTRPEMPLAIVEMRA